MKSKIYYIVIFIFFLIRFIIMSNNFNLLIDEYEFLSNSLNKIFKNNNKEIKNLLLKNNIKTRNNKISFSNALLYKFLYTYKNDSKQLITSTLNYYYNLSMDRTTYHKKDLMIPHTFYKDLFYKIRNLYNEHLKSNDKYNLIVVDVHIIILTLIMLKVN